VDAYVELIVDIVSSHTKFPIQSDPLTQLFEGVVSDILIKWVWDQVTTLSLVAMEQGGITDDTPVIEDAPVVADVPMVEDVDLRPSVTVSDIPPISPPTPPTPALPAVTITVIPETTIPPPVPESAPERTTSPFVEVDTVDEFEWDVIDKIEAQPDSTPSLFNFTIPKRR
jgi:hypothetical protein